MKIAYGLILGILLAACVNPLLAQKKTKAEKAARQEQAFNDTRKIVESNYSEITVNRVYPQSGHDVSRFNPSGYLTMADTLAKGRLPFFGRAYSLPYGEGGGIEFDAPVKDRSLKVIEKKRKKMILYQFTVPGKSDTYKFSLEFGPGENCTVNLMSNNRTQISYSGTVTATVPPGKK